MNRPRVGLSLLTIVLVASALALLAGCAEPTPPPPTATPTQPPPTATYTHTSTPSPSSTPTSTITPTPSVTPTETLTPTSTMTPTQTDTPTPMETPTPSITPTEEIPTITADGSVNCRYGPGTAYFYAYGLHEGDVARLDGRNDFSTWFWVRPEGLDWNCWVGSSVVTPSVDPSAVPIVYPQLYVNPAVPSLTGVSASRNGSKVTISWNPAPPAVDLGYLIEARICTSGYQMDVAYSTTNTSYTLTDETSCSRNSYGKVRVFNKLGYGNSVKIPWP
ncbi:MAG: hypothetical protein GTO18_06650 [Anaerolineales bacterium]|nr:hypothetical protein [Anaerolineales bacterium]